MKLNEAIIKMANSSEDCEIVHASGVHIKSGWSMANSAMRLYIPRDIKKLPEDGWTVKIA